MTHATDAPASGAHANRPPMISLRSVDKHFGDLHVLKDINLEVPAGQVVIVIGPSGSGKSTLCRTINRLEPIDSGTIEVDGSVLPAEGKALAALRADVGMVFQSFNLFAHKTILENVMLEIMYEIPSRDDIKNLEITEEIIRGEASAFENEDKVPASG